MNDTATNAVDATAVAVTGLAWLGHAPEVAAMVTALYMALRCAVLIKNWNKK